MVNILMEADVEKRGLLLEGRKVDWTGAADV